MAVISFVRSAKSDEIRENHRNSGRLRNIWFFVITTSRCLALAGIEANSCRMNRLQVSKRSPEAGGEANGPVKRGHPTVL